MKKQILLTLTVALCSLTAAAQWATDEIRVTPLNQTDYGREVQTTEDGTTYITTIVPRGDNILSFRLQIVDKDGRAKFPEDGLEVSAERNRTWVAVNRKMFIDRDGNAIMAVSDSRNAPAGTQDQGYTIYKIAPDGTSLWPEGVDLAGGKTYPGTAAMNIAQTTDGGYVFAYETYGDDVSDVRVEKLTADGRQAWDSQLVLADETRNYAYPYVVDAGDNQVMLVCLAGTNQDIMARLIDFDGSSVWAEDTKVYQGGFDDIPAWTYVAVRPAPGGGAFVSWRDDRLYEGSFSNYVSYVKNDGTLGFPGGTNALKISYADDYSRMDPDLVLDEADGCLYAVYRQFIQGSQSYCGIFMQKISLSGELLWGPEGKAIIDIQNERAVGFATAQLSGDGGVTMFWQTNDPTGKDTRSYAMKYDKDGNAAWSAHLEFATVKSEKSDLQSSALIDGKYWITSWEDCRDYDGVEPSCLYMQRINADGTAGLPAPSGITGITAAAGPSTVYDASGRTVGRIAAGEGIAKAGLRTGIYIVKDNLTGTTRKITIK